ncbi:glycoprotease pgp1 [Diaporthe sp. PMI_573]|nr:glycoprotease pgp1 [Diaporthaceae sp. PMI_573]
MARLWALPRPVLRPGVPRALSIGGPTLRQCSQRRALFTLGIETSCDDTCVSILHTREDGPNEFVYLPENHRVTCANKHHRGVHPVEAVKSHTRNLPALVQTAITRKGRPDLIAVTRGPGMKPCLSVGVSFAKALSVSWGVPLVGVHHMQAHALSIQLDAAQLLSLDKSRGPGPQYPFLNLLVSGGHTMLVYTKSAIEHRVLASTQRGITNSREKGSATAVGEMLDKCGRDIVPERSIPKHTDSVVYAKQMSDFCRVNGKYRDLMQGAYEAPQKRHDEIEIYESENGSWSLRPPLRLSRDMTYEFAGFGGQVRKIISERPDMENRERAELAYQTMRLAFEHIMSRVIMALQDDEELLANPPQSLVISGGVASNQFLRTVAASMLQARGFGNMNVTAPRPYLCTDNAAMIAWAGQKMYRAGWTTDLSFLPQAEWPIEEILTGVDCWVRKDAVNPQKSGSNATASQQGKTELPGKPELKEPPLPSTATAPLKRVQIRAPDAGAAPRREAKAKSVTSV